MEKANNKVIVTLGDWSGDGHGHYDKYEIFVSCTLKEMQDAYKASCKLTGISFNGNDDFTGIERSYAASRKNHVCTDYEESGLSEEVKEKFNELNCPWEELEIDEDYVDQDAFLGLLMWFISLSIPDFSWRKAEKEEITPHFNGWWNDELNVHLGYGLYY